VTARCSVASTWGSAGGLRCSSSSRGVTSAARSWVSVPRRVIPCALSRIGYKVLAIDIEPEPYVGTTECCSVETVKRDLERPFTASLELDCIVFTEVWDVKACLRGQFERC